MKKYSSNSTTIIAKLAPTRSICFAFVMTGNEKDILYLRLEKRIKRENEQDNSTSQKIFDLEKLVFYSY